MSEAANIRKNGRYVAVGNAEPAGECSRKFIHARARNPTAVFGVIGPVNRQRRKFAIQLTAADRAAHHELMAAPSMITSAAVTRKRSPEVRRCKSGYRLSHA